MIFVATLAGQSARGNQILTEVSAENGMRRDHVWLDVHYRGLFPAVMRGSRLIIRGQYRRYRDGPDGWTIWQIRSAEVVP